MEIPAQSQPQPTLPSLAGVMEGKSVEIYNDWNGYSDITPILRHYKLQLQHKQLVGNAHVAIGGYGAAGIHQQKTTRVKIPAAVTTNFLVTLARTPLQVGTYKPVLSRSDDYPNITIQIKTDRQQLIFSSQSQGRGYTPWRVTLLQGKIAREFISNSTVPARALDLLKPYIGTPAIDRLIQLRQQRKK